MSDHLAQQLRQFADRECLTTTAAARRSIPRSQPSRTVPETGRRERPKEEQRRCGGGQNPDDGFLKTRSSPRFVISDISSVGPVLAGSAIPPCQDNAKRSSGI